MAKLNSGILGPISGKVAGVVGARWKGQSYVRAHVIPGASNTDAQVAQRARFAFVVIAAKYFVGRVFNPYYDKFLPKVSGFNRFVTNNIPKAPDYVPVTQYQVTDGPLYPGASPAGVYTTGTGVVAATWSTDLGVDGAIDDVAIGWVRDRGTNRVWFGADTTRVAGSMLITCDTGLLGSTLEFGVFFAKLSGSVVSKISRNLVCSCTAA